MMSDDDELVRLTVNLIPKAVRAVDRAADLTGDTKTDCINRALQIYAVIVDPEAQSHLVSFDRSAGDRVRIMILPVRKARDLSWRQWIVNAAWMVLLGGFIGLVFGTWLHYSFWWVALASLAMGFAFDPLAGFIGRWRRGEWP